MSAKFSFGMSAIVLGSVLCLQTSAAMAGMVNTDEVAVQSQISSEKSRVQAFLDRANVKQSLQALGVEDSFAKDRVAAMTDQEVHAMAQQINSMPAGGRLGDRDLTLILLIVLLILII